MQFSDWSKWKWETGHSIGQEMFYGRSMHIASEDNLLYFGARYSLTIFHGQKPRLNPDQKYHVTPAVIVFSATSGFPPAIMLSTVLLAKHSQVWRKTPMHVINRAFTSACGQVLSKEASDSLDNLERYLDVRVQNSEKMEGYRRMVPRSEHSDKCCHIYDYIGLGS